MGKTRKVIVWGCIVPLSFIFIVSIFILILLTGGSSKAASAFALFIFLYAVSEAWPILLLLLIVWFLLVSWYQSRMRAEEPGQPEDISKMKKDISGTSIEE